MVLCVNIPAHSRLGGSEVWGLRFGDWGIGFRDSGMAFGDSGSGIRVLGLGLMVQQRGAGFVRWLIGIEAALAYSTPADGARMSFSFLSVSFSLLYSLSLCPARTRSLFLSLSCSLSLSISLYISSLVYCYRAKKKRLSSREIFSNRKRLKPRPASGFLCPNSLERGLRRTLRGKALPATIFYPIELTLPSRSSSKLPATGAGSPATHC